MSDPSILIVDDEVSNFDVIETILIHTNYQLNYVDSGLEAVKSLELFQPDLILLDVMMPGMDGITTCQNIKAITRWQSVPIIMITALTTKEDLARCLEAGADDFISKPLHPVELRSRVDSMLRIKQQYDDLQSLLKLRENMVDMIVCDLRVPLRSALLGLDLLENEVLSQERRKEILTTAYSSAQTLEIMVDDLLKIALVESGKIHLCRVKVNPCEFIQAMVSELKKNITSEHCQLVMQFPEEPIRDIFIDVTLVRRCLHYLLMNVFLFTEVNSQVILKLVILSPEEFKIQAIDPKLRYSNSLNRNLSGKYELGTLMSNTTQIGLELTFSKMVVEAHNGRINISQNESQGTILEVALSG